MIRLALSGDNRIKGQHLREEIKMIPLRLSDLFNYSQTPASIKILSNTITNGIRSPSSRFTPAIARVAERAKNGIY